MIILALLESIGYLLWILTFVGLIAFAIFEGRGVYTKHTIAFRGVKNDLYKAISVTFVIWIVFFVISLFSYRIDYIGLIYLFSLIASSRYALFHHQIHMVYVLKILQKSHGRDSDEGL